MLTIKDFTTNHENLVNLLSVATYGNEWPVVKAFKSDAEKGLFNDCECREDKWAEGLLHGKGVMVYDCYDENIDENADDFTEFRKIHQGKGGRLARAAGIAGCDKTVDQSLSELGSGDGGVLRKLRQPVRISRNQDIVHKNLRENRKYKSGKNQQESDIDQLYQYVILSL